MTCWGTGTPLREFLHADDLGEACVFALENWSALSENAPGMMGATAGFLNVGTGIDLSIRELAEQVAAAVGFQRLHSLGPQQTGWHPKETTRCEPPCCMGWRARIELSEGLISTVTDFEQSERRVA